MGARSNPEAPARTAGGFGDARRSADCEWRTRIRLAAKAGKRKLKDEFLTVIRGKDGKDALDSVADYWFEANWEKLKGPQP